MIVLYGPAWTRAQRVMWMLEELEVDYEQRPEWPSPELAPSGKVPVLVDGETAVRESLAINLHLASSLPGPLTPDSPDEWARTCEWTLWVASDVEMDLQRVTLLRREAARGRGLANASQQELERDLELRQRLEAEIARSLERVLERRTWLAADRFTVADLNVASVLALAAPSGVDMASLPAVTRWMDACAKRPAARRTWKRVIEVARQSGFVGDLDAPDSV